MPPYTTHLRFLSPSAHSSAPRSRFRSLALVVGLLLGTAATFSACDSEYPPQVVGTSMQSTGGSGPGTGGAGGASNCSSTTYANFGMSFISKYCVACHTPLFSTQSGVKGDGANIKAMAALGSIMPPAGALPVPTAAERTQLGAWIDCGVP